MSHDIFRRIQSAALTSDPYFPADDHVRWIARESEDDAELMADSSVEFLPLGMRMLAASIKQKNERYFCFVGLPIPEVLPAGLETVKATPGLFSSVVCEADIPASATAAKVRGLLEGEHKGVPEYSGHPLDRVMEFFPILSFFRVTNESDEVYLTKLDRVSGSYYARGHQGYPLAISSDTRIRIVELFESGPDTIPFYLPLQGLLSYNWSAFFLDLYRCLEQLYSVPRLVNLIEKIRHEGSLADLASVLEAVLSWRPREEESLSALLNNLSQSARQGIIAAICSHDPAPPEPTAEKCATQIYKLRNSHVHFRPAIRPEKMELQQWDQIIAAMCSAVTEVYSVLGQEFLKVRKI